MYHLRHSKDKPFVVDDKDWVIWGEIEAVLDITQVLTKLAQYESLYMAAYSPVVKQMVYDRLCASTIAIIDQDSVTEDPKLPRNVIAVTDMTDIGRTCRERAIIEFERRFLQSKLDVRLPLDSPLRFIHINDRQLAATLIDLRTAKCAHLTPSQRTAAQSALSTRYVAFYVQYFAFERAEKAEAATAQRAAEAAVAAAATVPVVVAKKAKTADSALASGMAYGGADDMDGFTFDDADSGDDSEEEEVQKTEADFAAEDKVAAEAEFKHVFKTWVTLNVDWRAAFPEAKLGQGQLDLVKDLMSLDMGQFYKKVISEDPGRVKYGFMPMLTGCGDGQIGALNAESFA